MAIDPTNSFPHVTFHVHREAVDETGGWNPVDEEGSFDGGLQINLYGSTSHYLQLADAIRAFAQKNTAGDSEFHLHLEGIKSVDGRTRLHLILRKDDTGTSSHSDSFPK